MDFNGFLKKIAFIRKINRHIIGSFGDLLFYQRMFFVIHAGEMQKCQHIAADIFAFFHTMPIFMRTGGLSGIPVTLEVEKLSVMLE